MLAAVLLLLLPTTEAAWDASRYLWYTGPASNFAGSLPIGNGRVAASIYGSTTEKITLNENSVWSGPWQDRANRNSLGALSTVRSLLQKGDISGAGQKVLDTMAGNPISPRAYNPLVDMVLDFGHGGTSNYTRYLDTQRGNGFVTYVVGGVNYTREYVASNPAGIVAARLSASQAGKLNVKISLARTQWVLSQNAAVNGGSASVVLVANSGQSSGAITFSCEARIVNDGSGTLAKNENAIQVTGATTVDIFFDAETSYRYTDQAAWEAELKKKLDNATSIGYDKIKESAIADFSALASRVHLDLGSSGSTGTQPTDTRLAAYKKTPNADPQFVALYFNYGRHLLISSSRDTGARSLPANLQGIWNDQYNPPWQSKYTININTEMNYWPALVTNLAETHKPLFDLVDVAIPRGVEVAKIMYGCDNGGFVLHHNTDLWGDAAPVDKGTPYMMWPMGGVWLSAHLMEHYRFTQDVSFLKTRAWPVLQKNANFFFCYLFDWQGSYNTGPSLSPENTFVVPTSMTRAGASEGIDISPTMDIALLHELFTNIIEASKVLNLENDATVTKAKAHLAKLRPIQIGSKGKLLEWRQEYNEAEPGHRHMSPAYGLYPGSQMTPLLNNTLAQAAKTMVDRRMSAGSGSTGWSRSWVMNLYARLQDGSKVWSNGIAFLQKYPTANLWNSDSGPGSSFQIDGNFGFTAAIAEMLLQSHGGEVHILPALPTLAVPRGSVTGLVARGGFVVDAKWDGGRLTEALVLSQSGGTLALRVQGKTSGFTVNGTQFTGPIQTAAGNSYKVVLST